MQKTKKRHLSSSPDLFSGCVFSLRMWNNTSNVKYKQITICLRKKIIPAEKHHNFLFILIFIYLFLINYIYICHLYMLKEMVQRRGRCRYMLHI